MSGRAASALPPPGEHDLAGAADGVGLTCQLWCGACEMALSVSWKVPPGGWVVAVGVGDFAGEPGRAPGRGRAPRAVAPGDGRLSPGEEAAEISSPSLRGMNAGLAGQRVGVGFLARECGRGSQRERYHDRGTEARQDQADDDQIRSGHAAARRRPL